MLKMRVKQTGCMLRHTKAEHSSRRVTLNKVYRRACILLWRSIPGLNDLRTVNP